MGGKNLVLFPLQIKQHHFLQFASSSSEQLLLYYNHSSKEPLTASMCWSTHYPSHTHSQVHHGDDGDTHPFTITAFFVRFRTSTSSEFNTHQSLSASKPSPFPESLTLYFPLSNDTNNRKVQIQFLSLHRMKQASTEASCVIFGSKQRVQVTTEALNFSLFVGEIKLLKGVIRKNNSDWKLECCKCDLPSCFSISEVELLVALDGHVSVIREKVVMPVVKKRNKYEKHMMTNKLLKLEDIPEETELCSENDTNCDEKKELEEDLEMDLEVLRRAMDMGIWVLCLGFGYMVSRASKGSFRPPRRFFDLHYFLS